MSNVIIMRRLAKRVLAANKDNVIGWAPIPAGGSLKHMWLNLHLMAPLQDWDIAAAYALAGYVLPVFDSDGLPTDPDTFWDRLVPKDVAMGADWGEDIIDTDAITTADGAPFLDWLKIQANQLFGGGMAGIKPIFEPRMGFTSFAEASKGFSTEGAADQYHPSKTIRFDSGRDIFCEDNSVALIAIANPEATAKDWTDDDGEWAPNQDHEWTGLQFLEDTLIDASKRAVGLDESADAGATEFGDEQMMSVYRALEQAYIDPTTDFPSVLWSAFCQTTFAIQVPGSRDVGIITSQ